MTAVKLSFMRRPAYRVLHSRREVFVYAPPGIQGVTYCAARHTGCYIAAVKLSFIYIYIYIYMRRPAYRVLHSRCEALVYLYIYIYILHNATRVGRNPMLRAYMLTCLHVYVLACLHACMLERWHDSCLPPRSTAHMRTFSTSS